MSFSFLASAFSADGCGRGFHFPLRATLAVGALCALAQVAGAASYIWNGAGPNWSTSANWTPAAGVNGPLAGDSVSFTNTSASTVSNSVNNVVDASFAGTIGNLTYNSLSVSPFVYNVTQIPTGKTLTVTNRLLVGGFPSVPAGPLLTYAILTGGGTLAVIGTNMSVENYGSAAGANPYANLDLSALSNFVFSNTNTASTISIADTTLPQTSGSVNVRGSGNLILAGASNSITVSTINLATCSAPQGGPLSTISFGAGTNNINVGNFNIANQKNPATALFTSPTGGLRIRGFSGTAASRANITVGNRNVAGGTGVTPGQMLLNGHPVDILANTLVVGEVSVTGGPSGAAGHSGNGTLQFDTGVIDATTVVMAFNSSPNAAAGISGSTSALTVGANATLRVGAGGLSLLNQSASNQCNSTLTISNGIMVCNGNITVATNAASGNGAAGETNTINFISGGTLILGSGNFTGTTNSPIGTLILSTNTSLRFVAPPPNQPAIAANVLVWPADDSVMTFVISNLPATAHVGTVIPLVSFNSMSGGSFTAPGLTLPPGVTGTLSLSGNSIIVTITSSIYPSLTTISPSLTTLCTNTALTTVASSTASLITNIQVITTTTMLGGLTTNTLTNTLSSPALTVTGLGTATANVSFALATNTIYLSATVKATDANGVTVSLATGKFDTLVPTLVIESSDFNFSSGQFIDTTADGGFALYQGKVGTAGIDEQKATRAATQSYYRPGDAVIMQNANPGLGTPPSLTEQKFVTAAANGDTVNVEQEVGFVTAGDWLNYTRTFGGGGSAPAGTYNVWCYLATSGSGVQARFSQVTSDPTQSGQTTNLLGSFGSATFSDNGFNNYVYVPLLDQFGNRATVTIGSGQQTFKSTIVGNPNIAFYALMPVAPVLTPTLLNVNPDGTAPYQPTNQLSFTVGPAQGASITTNGIHLVLNGVDVSAFLKFSQSGGIWTVGYDIASNFLYSATINVTNTGGLSTSYTFSFDTFDANSFQWEAVDYDFSTNNGTGDGGWIGGLFIDNPAPSGSTAAIPNNGSVQVNSYWYWPTDWTIASDGFGAIAQQGVDIYWPTNSNQGLGQNNAAYRFPDLVGSQVATDYLRFKFLVAQTNFSDTAICQYNIGYFYASNWLNYTRTYPTNTYNVWARIAGGGGAFTNATLSMVTSGVGTSNQTTQVLGSFSDSAPAGWQVYHTIPLLDANGNRVSVHLGGKATLRYTAPPTASPASGALNTLYFMLTPAATPAQFSLTASLMGNQMLFSFPTKIGFNYTVLYSGSLPATSWTQLGSIIPGDGTPHTISQSPNAAQGYYRVVAQ